MRCDQADGCFDGGSDEIGCPPPRNYTYGKLNFFLTLQNIIYLVINMCLLKGFLNIFLYFKMCILDYKKVSFCGPILMYHCRFFKFVNCFDQTLLFVTVFFSLFFVLLLHFLNLCFCFIYCN